MIEPGLSTGRRIAKEIKLAANGGRLGEILVGLKAVTEEQVLQLVAYIKSLK